MTAHPDDTAREYFPVAYFPPRGDSLDLDFTLVHAPAVDSTEVVDAPKPAPEPAAPADPPVEELPTDTDVEEAKATHPTKAPRSTRKAAPRPAKAPSRRTEEPPVTVVPAQEVPTQQAPTPKVPPPPPSVTPASADEDDLDDSMF